MRRVILVGMAVVVLVLGALPAVAALEGNTLVGAAKSDKAAKQDKTSGGNNGATANQGNNGATANQSSAQAAYPHKVCKTKKGKKNKNGKQQRRTPAQKKCKIVFTSTP